MLLSRAAANSLAKSEDIARTDDRDERGVFEHRDKLVAQRWNHDFKRLRQDDEARHLPA